MTNVSKDLKRKLEEEFIICDLKIEKNQKSKDGTTKFLFKLADGNFVEAVFIPEEKRNTLCISTQVGCALDCKFCLTGKMGFKRNLTVSEIICQIKLVERHLFLDIEELASKRRKGSLDSAPEGLARDDSVGGVHSRTTNDERRTTNIVFMGMGEPLLNFENLIKALEIITSDWGFHLSVRKVTVSTAGIIPKMSEFPKYSDVGLAISLNASNDKLRNKIMPINKKYPLADLVKAIKKYPLKKRRRLTIEYVMMDKINDEIDHAKELVTLLASVQDKVKINLIPYNSVTKEFKKSRKQNVDNFSEFLYVKDFNVVIRKSKGEDISAACGQLGIRPKTKD